MFFLWINSAPKTWKSQGGTVKITSNILMKEKAAIMIKAWWQLFMVSIEN